MDWGKVTNLLDTTSRVGLSRIVTLAEAQLIASKQAPRLCSREKALKYAEYLGRAMPSGEGMDAKIWLLDTIGVFSEYAETDVKKAVEHPTKGFRGKFKWLPVPVEMIEFLNPMRERRGRIIANARHVVAELTKPIEPPRDPEQDAIMARKLENLARELAGKRSLEAVEATQEQGATFLAEALAAGSGDYLRGVEALLGVEGAGRPETWLLTSLGGQWEGFHNG